MNLEPVKDFFNNLKENKMVQAFINELSSHLENSLQNNYKPLDSNCLNLFSDNLTLYGEKIISRFKDKILAQRADILQEYSNNTKEKGEMYYIYDINSNNSNSFNLCICDENKSNFVISKSKEELPDGATLGTVLHRQDSTFVIDYNGTKIIENEIKKMIKENIKEQHKFLNDKRIEGHVYKVEKKYDGRIWLYDLNNFQSNSMEEIEEIEFPENLYHNAKEGDLFIYQNGKYETK